MHPKLSPPPPPSSHSYPSLPILAISVIGILITAVLLLAYYFFITKCCLHSRRHLLLLFRLSPSPRRSRPSQFNHPATIINTQPHGLDPCTIRSIPTFRFVSTGVVHSVSRSVECAVCLAEFRDHDLLRLLPNCSHSFHVDCIDTWLQFNPNCPLCRDEITPLPIQQYYLNTIEGSHSSIEVREGSPTEESSSATTTSGTTPRPTKTRRFWKMGSMGDEWIDTMREKDERFVVDQPIRRSLSMDSSNDRQLYVSVQEILRQKPSLFQNGEGSSGGGGGRSGGSGGRIRRSFFSFGWSSRSCASVALPVSQSEL